MRFTDLNVLRAAVEELKTTGANIELVEGSGLVARSSRYAGAGPIPCDMMIRCGDSQWDVALVRDGDAWIPHLESDLRVRGLSADGGAQALEGCRVDYGALALGKLQQSYALLTAEINSAQAGYQTTRVQQPGGRVQLEVMC